MLSFVARSWRNHGNVIPIPFCQNLYTNRYNVANQVAHQNYNSNKQQSKPSYNFIDLITQYNINNNALAKNPNSCKNTQFHKPAVATAAAPQQQTTSTIKQTKRNKTLFEDIVVPCTFGEWIILRLMQSENKPMFLKPQQVEQIISLKESTNFDEQSLEKFYNILIAQNGTNVQSLPVIKPVQCLKQALYNAFNENCGNATQLCKFSLYKQGIARIEPLDSVAETNEKSQANNYYKQFTSMQGAGDTNNDKMIWRGKNGFIKLEPYQSNKLPEECDNLPKLYDVSTLDTQHLKNIKDMYESYEHGLRKMKVGYGKNLNRLPKWALKKYGYGGMDPNIVFDPTSNRYIYRNRNMLRKNQRRGKFKNKKLFQPLYNFGKTDGNGTTRLSEITGTNLKSSRDKSQKKSDDDSNYSNNYNKNRAKKNGNGSDFNDSKGGRKIKFMNKNYNDSRNRLLQDETDMNTEEGDNATDNWTLVQGKNSKNIDNVGAISKMMKMKARHAEYAALPPTLLSKLYKNAMANQDSVNPDELEALKIYVEQILPTASVSNIGQEPRWQPSKQNRALANAAGRGSVFNRNPKETVSFDDPHASKHKFSRARKMLKRSRAKLNVFSGRKRSYAFKMLF